MHKFRPVVFLSLLLCFPPFSSGRQAPTGQRKVGLVLSGGGARGAAHIGILKVLEREGIPIDCIAGTSFGALVGGLYSVGYNAAEIERIFTSQDWNIMFSDAPERRLSTLMERKGFRYQGQLNFEGFAPELPAGLWTGQKIAEILEALTTPGMIAVGYDFDRLRIPFRAVATNLLDGKAYVFRQGSMSDALRASIGIPMLFTPVEKDGMLLVDGGLADNLPCDVARQMGADIIIAVDVTSTLLKKDQIRSFFDVVDQSISLLMYQNAQPSLPQADLLIRPELDDYTYNDYARVAEIIKLGEKKAGEHVAGLHELTAGLPRRPPPPAPTLKKAPVVSEITFQGLKTISSRQLAGEVKARAGQPLNTQLLSKDLGRLYATRLFDTVGYNLKLLANDRYQLNYLCKEAPLHTLGASIRYDRDYSFVALTEFTARQLFHTPSTFTFSSQFGGFEDHSASLRYISPHLPFLFVEPKVHLRRRERLDIRDKQLIDTFTDNRLGGEFMLGGTFLKRLEVAAGYRHDRVNIGGGAPPKRLDGYQRLAGLTLRMKRDNLDAQEFPHSGLLLTFQIDKRSESLGGDVHYSKWQGDLEQYTSLSKKTTIAFRASAGYSHGDIPFYDQFFVGGFNASAGAARHLLGFSRDELAGRQIALAAVSFRRQIFSRPLSFIRRAFATGAYNVAAVSQSPKAPYMFQYHNGAGIGFAADSLIGPLRIVAGWGEGGRLNLYLSLGPGF